MHAQLNDAKKHLYALVAFDTTSRNSNLPLIEYIREFLESLSIPCQVIYSADRQKANLVARIGPERNGGFLYSGHTDTVPVDGQPWTTPPYELVEKNNKLFGRGTADMKGFVACCLALAPILKTFSLQRPIHMAFSFDEEVGCHGAPLIGEHIRTHGIRPELAIIGEPTEMQVITSHKGVYAFETVVTGLEAHSSTPQRGVNAVMIACELVQKLSAIAQEYRNGKQDARFDPPHTTVHVGTIQGGTARNIIPLRCNFLWEVRPVPGEGSEHTLSQFNTLVQSLEKEMKQASPNCGIETRRISGIAALNQSKEMLDEKHVLALTGANRTHAISFFTEAGIFQNYGIPCIVCGPGSVAQAHRPDEFVSLQQMDACLIMLERLARTLL